MKIDGLGHQPVQSTSELRAFSEATNITHQTEPGGGSDVGHTTTPDMDKALITEEMLDKSVEQANKSLDIYDKMIERSIHEKTKAVMYVLKDTRTNEVIREFPPKKIQDMIAKMWELAGLFVDEKA